MTVRTWFRLQRAALWEQQIGVAVEFDALANAVVEGDESTAHEVLWWLITDQPYADGGPCIRDRHRYQGITR